VPQRSCLNRGAVAHHPLARAASAAPSRARTRGFGASGLTRVNYRPVKAAGRFSTKCATPSLKFLGFQRFDHGRVGRRRGFRKRLEIGLECRKAYATASASMLFESNVPPHLVQRWLGHASLRTTAIHGEVVGPEERAFAARMWC